MTVIPLCDSDDYDIDMTVIRFCDSDDCDTDMTVIPFCDSDGQVWKIKSNAHCHQ